MLLSSDPLYSPKRTLARARQHVAELKIRSDAFMNGKAPGTYVLERGQGGNRHTIRFDRDYFEDLSCIAFDAANNLRSALDQTGYAAAIAAGKTKPENAYFPIARSQGKIDNLAKGRCADLPADIVALFLSFQPYGGGNLWLAALNTLCNSQKHAALIPFKTDQNQVSYVTRTVSIGLGHRWNQDAFELELLGMPGADFRDGGGHFAFGLSFASNEPVIGGSNPASLLEGAAIQVQRVLDATELECRRLGLMS